MPGYETGVQEGLIRGSCDDEGNSHEEEIIHLALGECIGKSPVEATCPCGDSRRRASCVQGSQKSLPQRKRRQS